MTQPQLVRMEEWAAARQQCHQFPLWVRTEKTRALQKQVDSKGGRSRYDGPGRPRAWRVLLMLQLKQTEDYPLRREW